MLTSGATDECERKQHNMKPSTEHFTATTCLGTSAARQRGAAERGRGRRLKGGLLTTAFLCAAAGCGQTAESDTPSLASQLKVQIVTPYAAGDAPGFSAALDDLREATGLEVEVLAESGNLVDTALLRIAAGNPPDLVVVPQPGVVKDLYELGAVKAFPSKVREKVAEDLPPGLEHLSTIDGELVSVWAQTSTSMMWYRSEIFAAKGWQPPTTPAEFDALVDRIAADGEYAAFCVGIEAKGATGWYLTDWLENLLLTRHGAELYDRWTSHQIPFNSPEVVEELQRMSRWFTDPDITYGTPDKVLSTAVEGGFSLIAQDPAPCVMTFNSQWVFATIQDKIDDGAVDVALPGAPAPTGSTPTLSAFQMPAAEGLPPALALGGDQLVALSDRPEVWQVIEYVASKEWGRPWAEIGGFLSPHRSFDTSAYTDLPSAILTDALHRTEVQRFDGTDEMPTEVGSGTAWSGMVDLVKGVDPQSIADSIEDSWGSAPK